MNLTSACSASGAGRKRSAWKKVVCGGEFWVEVQIAVDQLFLRTEGWIGQER